MNTRKTTAASHPPSNQMAHPRDMGVPPPNTNPMAATVPQRPPPNLGMASSAHLHHHHAHPDGSQPGTDDVSGMFHHLS